MSESTILYILGVLSSILSIFFIYLADKYNKDSKKVQDYYKMFFINVLVITILLFIYFNFISSNINMSGGSSINSTNTSIDLSQTQIQTGQPNF